MRSPEELAREKIDASLEQCGWFVRICEGPQPTGRSRQLELKTDDYGEAARIEGSKPTD
jgi:hypothetical protein